MRSFTIRTATAMALSASLAIALAAGPALAGLSRPMPIKPGHSGPITRGAPAPIAGAGLPIMLVAGGYVLVRRRFGRAGKTDKS